MDERRVEVFPLEPLEAGLPHVRSLVVVRKTSATGKKDPVDSCSYYVSTRLPGRAEEMAAAIRGHWGGCESRNHWVRDALWKEDQTRSKNWNLNANLAALRAGLIALRSQMRQKPATWPELFERCSHRPALALHLLHQRHDK